MATKFISVTSGDSSLVEEETHGPYERPPGYKPSVSSQVGSYVLEPLPLVILPDNDVEFVEHPDCELCSLSKGCKNVGMSGRIANPPEEETKAPPEGKALLVVGESPGFREDDQKRVFIHKSGNYLHWIYLKTIGREKAEVFLTNAVKCRKNSKGAINKGSITKCRPYLQDDICRILERYPELVILACGTVASQAVIGKKIESSFALQGGKLPESFWTGRTPPEGAENIRVYTTYHPAYLLPGRAPSKGVAVFDHLVLLREFLSGNYTPRLKLDHIEYEWAPSNFSGVIPKEVCLDIETYGLFGEDPERQTCFHPKKSVVHDEVEIEDLVHLIGVGWLSGGKDYAAVFDWRRGDHRRNFRDFFEVLLRKGVSIVGQHIQFDLMYTRFVDPVLEYLLKPFDTPLVELMAVNYLESEQRPERTLKALSQLLGVHTYSSQRLFSHATHPDCIAYFLADLTAPLHNLDILRNRTKEYYPPKVSEMKLSRETAKWYSDSVWLGVLMSEGGVYFDTKKLKALHDRLDGQLNRMDRVSREQWQLPLMGEGSGIAKDILVEEGVRIAGLERDRRIERSKTLRKISANDTNFNICLEALHPNDECRRKIQMVLSLNKKRKIVTSYTRPLLYGNVKGGKKIRSSMLVEGMAHPSWFVVPMSIKDREDKRGGTEQGRMTAKFPGFQTNPRQVSKCLASRFEGGQVWAYDLSQIELRMAAALSGDPIMVQEYRSGVWDDGDRIDRHMRTAELDIFASSSEFWPEHIRRARRQIGKTVNFADLFLAEYKTLQRTVRRDCGYEWPLVRIEETMERRHRRYKHFRTWQKSLIEEAIQNKRLVELVLGISRTFQGTRKTIEETYRKKIVNFPIQTHAALIMTSAMIEIAKTLQRREMRAVLCGNVYDSLVVDIPPGEFAETEEIVSKIIPSCWYLQKLYSVLPKNHHVPVEYEGKRVA